MVNRYDCHDRISNPRLGRVDEAGNSDHSFALPGETDNDLDWDPDFLRPVKVSERLGSHDAVIAGAIVIQNDFVEGADGEEEFVLFVVKLWEQVGENTPASREGVRAARVLARGLGQE